MHVIDGIRNENDSILRVELTFVYPWLTLEEFLLFKYIKGNGN